MPEEKYKTIKIKFSQYLLLLFFFFLIMALAVVYGNRMIAENIANYKNREMQKIALENRIANLSKLEIEYQETLPEIEKIGELLPSQENFIGLVSKIEEQAGKNKVDLTVDFLEEPQNHRLSAKLMAKGYYSDVLNFYKSISADSVLATIKSVKFSNANNLKDNSEAQLGVEVYFD